jgi:hypothetical protein
VSGSETITPKRTTLPKIPQFTKHQLAATTSRTPSKDGSTTARSVGKSRQLGVKEKTNMLPSRFTKSLSSWLRRSHSPNRGGKRRPRSGGRRRQLLFEPLEHRQLLAITDLGAIVGTVFDDFSGDGLTTGEEVSGAQVILYRDDGDTVFERGTDDPMVASMNTNTSGGYRFDDLTANGYFVFQPAQTAGGSTLLEAESGLITITTVAAAGTLGTTIDSFDTTAQSVTASTMTPTNSSDMDAPEAVGGSATCSSS